jgi:hypothetical protein
MKTDYFKNRTKNYWMEIKPKKKQISQKEDGKWVVFLRRNFNGIKKESYNSLVEQIQAIVDENGFLGALAKSKNLEVINFFTTADRDEIWKTKRIIKERLKVQEVDIIWKADFETDADWIHGIGNLWFISEIQSAIENQTKAISQGCKAKAKLIKKNAIDPLFSRFHKKLLEENTMNRNKMVVSPAFQTIKYDIDPSIVFVLMPFNEKWSEDSLLMIKQAAEGLPLKIQRADDIFSPGDIINDVWKMINYAGLIIADITTHNANVFYELGIAHTIGKKVVLIRQYEGEKAPFDLAFWRIFEYGLMPKDAEEFRKTLKNIFKNYLSEYPKIETKINTFKKNIESRNDLLKDYHLNERTILRGRKNNKLK